MPRGKKFTAEQIIGKLREAEVGLAQGKTVPEVVRKLGVTEQTYERREAGIRRAARRGRPQGKLATFLSAIAIKYSSTLSTASFGSLFPAGLM